MSQKQTTLKQPSMGALWLTEGQTAERLNVSAKWLQKERLRGGGLRFAKFGGAVRYSLADIRDFEAKCLRTSTSDNGGSA